MSYKPETPVVVDFDELTSALEVNRATAKATFQKRLNEMYEKEANIAYDKGYRSGYDYADAGLRKFAYWFFFISIPVLALIVLITLFFHNRVQRGEAMTKEEYAACAAGDQAGCARGINRLGGEDAIAMQNIFQNKTGKDINASGVKVEVNAYSGGKQYIFQLPEGQKITIDPK